MAKRHSVLLVLALCVTACEYFNRPLEPWIDEQYAKMRAVKTIAVVPGTAEVTKGAARQFSAQVSVRANAPQDVTWTVHNNLYTATTISAGGLLSVNLNEPVGRTLTVTATSVFDPAKSASATVTVRDRYTVTFDPSGGLWDNNSAAPIPVYVNAGEAADVPRPLGAAPGGSGFAFEGWYTAASGGARMSAFPYTPASDITLYARWKYTPSAAPTWAGCINAVNTAGPGSYLIEAHNWTVSASGSADNPAISNNVNLTVTGSGTIALNGNGTLLSVPGGRSVTIDGPTLQGHSSNDFSLVNINGGSFTLQSGVIRDNHSNNSAGAVDITAGTFTMNGGIIRDNSCDNGPGGVFVYGTFVLNSPASRSSFIGNTGGGAPLHVYIYGWGMITGTAGETAGW